MDAFQTDLETLVKTHGATVIHSPKMSEVRLQQAEHPPITLVGIPNSAHNGSIIRYLPRISLYVTNVPTYPATTPTYHLRCEWLNNKQITELALKLYNSKKNFGGLILLQKWCDTITSAKQWLEINGEFDLSWVYDEPGALYIHMDISAMGYISPKTAQGADKRRLRKRITSRIRQERRGNTPRCVMNLRMSGQERIEVIVRNNHYALHKELSQNRQTCSVCTDIVPGSRTRQCCKCLQVTCTNCLKMYMDHWIRILNPFVCLNNQCKWPISAFIIDELLPAHLYNLYLNTKDCDCKVLCPYRDCRYPQRRSNITFQQLCPICLGQFCQYCGETENLREHTCDKKQLI